MLRRFACAATLVASLVFAPEPAHADPIVPSLTIPRRCTSKQLCWAPTFNRMDVPEMVVTGLAASLALTMNILHPLNTGWSGGILFDDQVRNALRLSSYDAELEVRTASDLGLAIVTTYPLLVDSLITAYWYRGSADVALQMALIDMEAFAIAGAVEGTSNFLAGRARPYSSGCANGGIPSNTTDCATDTLNRSFFSGHTVVGFTAAALMCAHHEALHLFDNAGDHVTCAAGLAAATAIGVMRIMGDAHYFSDVFIGALVGTTIGLTIPLLHHYRRSSSASGKVTAFHLSFVPGFGTGQLVGTF